MPVEEIIALIVQGAGALQTAVGAYNQIKDTISETDQQKIHEALLAAEAATDDLRPKVDAALDEASKK